MANYCKNEIRIRAESSDQLTGFLSRIYSQVILAQLEKGPRDFLHSHGIACGVIMEKRVSACETILSFETECWYALQQMAGIAGQAGEGALKIYNAICEIAEKNRLFDIALRLDFAELESNEYCGYCEHTFDGFRGNWERKASIDPVQVDHNHESAPYGPPLGPNYILNPGFGVYLEDSEQMNLV